MGKSTANKKNPKTPKDVSGGRSGSTAVDEDMKIHERAMLRYRNALDLLPKDHIDVAYLRTSIASCFMQMGLDWYPNAISELDLALEASPRYSKALLKRSQCYEALNKLDYAFGDAQTVLIMEPKNVSANEIFERVKKRLVDEGIDVGEMEKNFVYVQPVGAARLRKIVKENVGKDDEVKSNRAVVESPKVDMGDEAESKFKPNEKNSDKPEIDGKMGGNREVTATESTATDVDNETNLTETNSMDDLNQEAKDHLLAQQEMDKNKLGLHILENPKPQSRRILGESSTKTHTYRLYSKGLVSEETIKDDTMPVGALGLSLCDSNDNSELETSKALRNEALTNPEAAELAAIIYGLSSALELGVESIQFFCDDSIILDYLTGKTAPPKKSIVATILKKVATLQQRFKSCEALPLHKDINSVVKLARDAIALQTRWQREDGVEVEFCPICCVDVPPHDKHEVSGCFHRICFTCMRNCLQYILDERQPLICPIFGCQSELETEECIGFADPPQIKMMIQRKKENAIPVSDRVYCPKPSCNFLMSDRDLLSPIDPRHKSVARKCVECGLCFCKKCHVPWHDKKTCDEFKKSESYRKSDDALFESLVKREGWMKCPQCATVIQRSGGCKRITCRDCKHKFCFTCGAPCTRRKMTCKCYPGN